MPASPETQQTESAPRFIRICPACFDSTGDTFEFDAVPPMPSLCDCGSALQPHQPTVDGAEGWLHDRDYSEAYGA